MKVIRKFEFDIEDCAIVQKFLDWCDEIEEDSDWEKLGDEVGICLGDTYEDMNTLLRYMEDNRWDKGGR